jgi:membrane protein involved in colicin uptake
MIPISAYKPIGLVLVLLMFGGACYYQGYAGEHDKLITFKAQVDQAAKDQNDASKKKDAENEAQTLAVAQAYGDAYNNSTSGGQLPPATQGAQGSNGASGELSGACQGTDFYANALEDALKLQSWQEWARRMNLQIE